MTPRGDRGTRFANILLSGPCNLTCPHCVGRHLARGADLDNLDRWPLAGLDAFCARLRTAGVTQVSLTGTNTDPLLYQHHHSLTASLRRRVPDVRLSLHTNGVLALARMETLNSYDRVCVSLPSLGADTCRRMTGRARPLDLHALARGCRVPLKISVLVTRHNADEVPHLVARCGLLGIGRVVLRKLHLPGNPAAGLAAWQQVQRWLRGFPRTGTFGRNPVLSVGGVELTLWDFEQTELRCLNLFADGEVSSEYELTRDPAAAGRASQAVYVSASARA